MQVHNSIDCSGGPQQIASVQVVDDNLRKAVCSLNLRQRKTFKILCHWARDKLKQMNSVFENVVEPLHLVITGDAGVGKSHLVKILTSFLTKAFNLYSRTPDKKKILFLAPTGLAALNIDGTTIHSRLGINPNCNTYNMGKHSKALKVKLRCDYSEIVAVAIDEISVASNITLLQIHKRVCGISGCSEAIPFAGKTVILVGDLFQLPPVRASFVFSQYDIVFGSIFQLWDLFKICELTEVMRQQGDPLFIDILNAACVGELSDRDIEILNNRKGDIENVSADATVIFAENSPKDSFNKAKLENLSETDLEIFATDKIPERTPSALIENLNAKSQSSTGGIEHCLPLKEGARVMLTVNIDLSDHLVNWQLGTVDNIIFTESGISNIYLKYDDPLIGKQLMCNDFYSNTHQVVPINRVESRISLTRKNNLHMISRT